MHGPTCIFWAKPNSFLARSGEQAQAAMSDLAALLARGALTPETQVCIRPGCIVALYLYLFWCWSLTCTRLTYNACKHCPFSMGQMPTRTLSLCTTTHPLYTMIANIFGASVSEATMRPNPRSGWRAWTTGCRCRRRGSGTRGCARRAPRTPSGSARWAGLRRRCTTRRRTACR
jgi:hypothetical protein